MTKLYESTIEQVLPTALKEEPEVQAISYALMKANQRIMDKISQTMIYAGIDKLPETLLDVLAAELRSQYYEPDMDIEKKRKIVKNTLYLYEQAGTPAAVEEMIHYMFDSGELIEWFENDGIPGTFEIRTTAQATQEAFVKFSKVIKKVKNARSHLTAVNFGSRAEMTENVSMGMIMAKTVTIL